MTRNYRRRRNSQIQARLNRRLTWILCAAVAVLVIAGWVQQCSASTAGPEKGERLDNEVARRLQEVIIPETTTNQLIDWYTGFTVGFNNDMRQPNYVVWELTGDETEGKLPRHNKFLTDYRVQGCAEDADYRRSGYDRGHMAPAADMKWSEKAMTDCFYFTNICPQANALNSGAWSKLESKCREWARRDSALIIVCGPILTDELNETIGPDRVPVPKRFFKVVLAPYTNPPRAIGFIMNNGRVEGGIQAAAVSVDEVERVTGFDFFSALPDDIENKIEAECRFAKWSMTR